MSDLRTFARSAGASRRTALNSTSAAAIALMFAAQAAQAQTAAPAQAEPVEEIVITGSNIVRDGYQAPTPVTVVGIEEIQAAGKQDIADYVNTLPAMVGSLTPQSNVNTQSTGVTGVNALNLRGLGIIRTLVLLDGQRSVPSAVDGTVDVTEFPQSLVSRVDVVTGGASAAYGSDAVAGVVNFVLDKKYVGIKGEAQGGVSTYGDDRSWMVSLTAGTGFSQDKGHFLISGEVSVRDGIMDAHVRAWNREGWQFMPNPAYGTNTAAGQSTSVPQYLFLPGSSVHIAVPGGIIASGPLKGITFGPGGVPFQFNYGSIVGGNWMQGGDWKMADEARNVSLDPLNHRQSIFLRTSYDVTDSINAYVQAQWAHVWNLEQGVYDYNLGNLVIKADNPFIPQSVQAQMAALKLTSFNLGGMYTALHNYPIDTDHPSRVGDNNRTVNRYVVGATGKFDALGSGWTWDGYFQNGVTRTAEAVGNIISVAKFALAVDAVRAPNGAIVCRSTLTNPTNGCVPYNPMGINVNGAAQSNYIEVVPHRNQHIEENVLSMIVRGEPFSNWAGPVSVSTGIQWRREHIDGVVNSTAANGEANGSNFQATNGQYDVTEGFVEAVIPLAANTSWAKSMDLNAAIRGTGYTTSGYVTTWKVGATYQPIDDVRIRASRSRDIRAPNLTELYNAGNRAVATIQDPFNNNAVTLSNTITLGNINLLPEKADTTEVGIVVQPAFFPGFSASVDYWNIDMDGQIASISAAQILSACYQGVQIVCGAFSRANDGPGGTLQITTRVTPFNLAAATERGMDFEASYRLKLNDIVDSWDGGISVRALASHYLKNYTNNAVTPPTDTVGSNGGSGPPNWTYNVTFGYSNDTIDWNMTVRGFSTGTFNNTYIGCTSGCPVSTLNNPTVNVNTLKGPTYLDTSFAYKFGIYTAFLNVQNVTNRDPEPYQAIGNSFGFNSAAVNYTLYSGLGRMFRAGIRFKM